MHAEDLEEQLSEAARRAEERVSDAERRVDEAERRATTAEQRARDAERALSQATATSVQGGVTNPEGSEDTSTDSGEPADLDLGTPVETVSNAGPFQVTDAHVRQADDGTLQVLAVVTNTGPPVDSVLLTVTALANNEPVGTADGIVALGFGEFDTGQVEGVSFVGEDAYTEEADTAVFEVVMTNEDG